MSLSQAGLRIDPERLAGASPAERELILEQLVLLEEELKRNPLLGYRPHHKQAEFHSPPFPPLRAFFGGNRCLAEGTLVRMADGCARPIESIRVGDMVLGSTEAGSFRPVEVLEVWENGPKECFEFRFGKRGTEESLVATADHRVSAWHEKGYRAVLPLGAMEGCTRFRWSIQRATYNTDLTPQSEPYALLYGLLLGDGCTVNGRVQFTCADPEVLELAERECARFSIKIRQNSGNSIQYHLSTGLQGSPNKLSVRLRQRGMACYAHEKRLPNLTGWSNEDVAQLLAGLFVTDGSVWQASEGWRFGYTSVSCGLVEDVKWELEQRFGVYGSTVLVQERTSPGRPRRTEYSLTYGNFESLRRLSFRLPLYAKLKKLRRAVDEWEGKRSDASRLRYRGREAAGVFPTYDLHVDHPDHLFVLANGMLVHNSGKTTAAMCDTIIQCVDRDVVPEHLKAYKRWDAPFKCRIMTPDFGDTHEVVLEKIREWCPRPQLKGGSFDRAYDKQKKVLWFKNGSRLHFNSNVQDREQLGGSDLHRVLYDEEPRRDLRTESLTRLIDHDGEEIFAMTPLEGMSWLYDEIYEPWERLNSEDVPSSEVEERLGYRVLVVDMDDNPHLSDAGKKRALAAYSGAERQARKSGLFVSFAGLIYPTFSTREHVIPDEDELPDGVECFEGLDPGLRHMAAVLFCYLDAEDRLVVYDELAIQGKTVSDVAKQIKLKRMEWRARPAWTVIDPAARNKSAQTGRSDQQEYSDCGIVAFPGQNDVRAGLNRVMQRLEADPPRLLIAARCTELRSEFKKYRWQKDSTRTEGAAAERPVKRDDHLLDALRYVVMARPLKPDRDVARESDTMKDRILRHHLRRLKRPQQQDSGFGPGQFL